jgi:chromosome condensin MukBEF ATPase and DNA-binding subunit MukB
MAKLEKIAAKNSKKIERYLAKAERIKARIEQKIFLLSEKNEKLGEEAAACKKTADKLNDFFA